MTNSKSPVNQELYLHGSQRPDFIAKGLYAGLKSRNGLATALPLEIKPGEEYVNAGFLDGLPASIIRDLEPAKVHLQVNHIGPILVSIYVLLKTGEIFHCSDHELGGDGQKESKVSLPSTALGDSNAQLIYFRIQAINSTATLQEWFFTTPDTSILEDIPKLVLISRSLGESPDLVKRYVRLCDEYLELQKRHTSLRLLPIPHLKIYESDHQAFNDSLNLLGTPKTKHITLIANPYNLGGGGNMCLAVYQEVVCKQEVNLFGMIDSDTILPFRTFYLATLIGSRLASSPRSRVKVPIVLYSSKPGQILEYGSLFGRGNWGIVSQVPTQPCISTLHHRQHLNKSLVQATVAGSNHTDYPPFIFSLFSAKSKQQVLSHFLPTPFFLRGDDIEMGQNLCGANIPCEVDGSLVVFQEPKHSLWHEFMAILHGTCLVLSAASSRNQNKFPELEKYFLARAKCHARIRDVQGLNAYERVLDRLTELKEWPKDELVSRFHDPSYYLTQRDLNTFFSSANMLMVEAISQNKITVPSEQFIQLPFIYCEPSYFNLVKPDAPLPQRIALVNSTQKTAAIIEPYTISKFVIQEIHDRIADKTRELFSKDAIDIAARCMAVTNREQIVSQYLSKYPLSN
jgi:hypothetical protein